MGARWPHGYAWRHMPAVGLLALVCALASAELAATPARRPPNIVIILVDDLGYGDVRSNFSESQIPTPNIDQLAQQGIRFTDAHSGAAVCSPTRYGLLTGRNFSRQP